jgi:putative SOS response-associated peptidase YedK
MIPFWTKNNKVYYHAPMEGSNHEGNSKMGIILDPIFRKPIREQRGLLPVDYFIVETDSGIPYLVFLKEKKQRSVGLACVWDMLKKEMTDDLFYGFSIITVPAYGKFEKIGVKRMPMILPDHHYKKWLRNNLQLTQVTQMFSFFDDKELNAFPISPEILTQRGNDKTLIEAKGEIVEQPKPEMDIPKQVVWYHRRKKFEDSETWATRRQ